MGPITVRHGLPRDLRAMTYLTSFVVTTVATVLVTRAALALSGFPQLGGSGLHIGHVLWGGLVMAVGLVALLSFVGPVMRPIAAIVSGIGFGLFIDEVGKFVTGNNDYFFRPAAAIMYVVIVVFVLIIQWIHGRRRPTRAELLAGAMAEATGGTAGGISDGRRARALALAREAGDEPGAAETAAVLAALPRSTHEIGDPLVWLGDRIRRVGRALVGKRWLRVTTVVILCINALSGLLTGVVVILIQVLPDDIAGQLDSGTSKWVAIPGVLSAVCVVVGVRRLRQDRFRAYNWFARAVLIDLLLTQPFEVASNEFSALPSIAIDLIMLAVVGAAKSAARDAPEAPADALSSRWLRISDGHAPGEAAAADSLAGQGVDADGGGEADPVTAGTADVGAQVDGDRSHADAAPRRTDGLSIDVRSNRR